jgi:hypothetical protein
MSAPELFLLTPYRLPTQNTLYLAEDDVAAFLNGYAALWHPAALLGAKGPPRPASPYDHEQPGANIYALPDSPPLLLPDDWEDRARTAGAVFFRAGADRAATVANLKASLRPRAESDPAHRALLDLDPDKAAAFPGIGLGFLHVEALFEAMSHENLLSAAELWQEVQNAVTALSGGNVDESRRQLQAAADRLLAAREVLYPVTIHVVDLLLLDPGRLDAAWPAAFDRSLPLNVVACASLLERLGREQPDRLAALREHVGRDVAEVCGGPYAEREDVLLPIESQVWNLVAGQTAYRELLGQEVRVFGRRRFGFHPQIPLLLQSTGVNRALLLNFDEGTIPQHRSCVVNWPAPDGKQVEAFTRTPHPADSSQTGFHLAHYLHKTIMQDQAATLPLLHCGKPTAAWYDDLLELSRLAPVLGRWTTMSGYFNEVIGGDYVSAAEADEFHDDHLVERTPGEPVSEKVVAPTRLSTPHPVSAFATQARCRRKIDTTWTLAALHRSLGGKPATDGEPLETRLQRIEDRFEAGETVPIDELDLVLAQASEPLAGRLVSRGAAKPGYLLLNPCSYTRRLVVDLPDTPHLLPTGDPVKACQVDGTTLRAVVEVPALGFAWVPKGGDPAVKPSSKRMKLADEKALRNEFFEAEIDPQTGGLRAIRDHRTRTARLGQMLVYNPGSTMRVGSIKVMSTGPALGEIVTDGTLVDTQQQVIATYRQRFQAWIGRPMLDLRIEINPTQPPTGYPWHAYYAARFAWRDEREPLVRGVNGFGYLTTHARPQSPDYLELRRSGQNTVIFPGGLPFQQRHGNSMLDVLLITPGETCRTFDLGIGVDRFSPAQTAQGMVTPLVMVPTTQGPPHVGATGWLAHLDASNLLLTALRPAPDGKDGVVARVIECAGVGASGDFRFVRNPTRGTSLDGCGRELIDLTVDGDAVRLDVGRNDIVQMRVEFGG